MTYDTYIEQTQNLIHNVLYLNEKRILPMSHTLQYLTDEPITVDECTRYSILLMNLLR
jgi:hypothetical protein